MNLLSAFLGMTITLDGQDYEVAHKFSESRVLVNYCGLYTFADKATDGTWELSGEPARQDEKPVLEALLAPTLDQSILTVTKD